MKQNVRQFFQQFPDDNTCLEHLFNLKYGQGFECPKCEKSAKWYPLKSQRAYSCQWCGHHIHPTVGTLFESSRTPLQLWFYAIYLFTTTRHGVSAKELQRQLGVTYKTAWRMGHEIRKYMAELDGDEPLDGFVEVDETYIGGKSKGKRGRGAEGKTIVVGMMERNGDIITEVVDNVKKNTLQAVVQENVEAGSHIYTDELRSYNGLVQLGYGHSKVNHGSGEYVSGDTHVNGVEGYWSILKKSLKSTHIHVSRKHMNNYMKEFEFRFNSRQNPETMLPRLLNGFYTSPS